MVKSIIYYYKKGLTPEKILYNLREVFPDRVEEEKLTITDIDECIKLWEESRYN